jgi:hypothetical protein
VKVRELIAALEKMPSEDEVLIFDGASPSPNNSVQPLDEDSVHMSDDLTFVVIEA